MKMEMESKPTTLIVSVTQMFNRTTEVQFAVKV